jgi:hypothetical protein
MINSELTTFNTNQKKYVKKINNLIKYYNLILLCLKKISSNYNNTRFIKKHTLDKILFKIVNDNFYLEKFQLHILEINKKCHLILYDNKLINDDIFSKNVNDFIYIIDDENKINEQINSVLNIYKTI